MEVTRLLKRTHLSEDVLDNSILDSDTNLILKKKKRLKLKKSKQYNFYQSVPDVNTNNFYDWPGDIKAYFTRIYSYKKSENGSTDNVLQQNIWCLPSLEYLYKSFYQYPILKQWSRELNEVKSRLNSYPILFWSSHTSKTEPCNRIVKELKNREGYDVVTISWIKLQEILYSYPELCPHLARFNSLHLCEAPGSFIASLNHYLQNNYSKDQIKWDWLATTLNPYYEGNNNKYLVNDDRFIQHTLDHWIFSEDQTGNIVDLNNINYIKRKCEERFKLNHDGYESGVHLITADGSFDCTSLQNNQEEAVGTLFFSEILTTLSILNDGGSFVLKMFTAFESYTVSFVYLLNCVFEKVDVFKPITSKRANSEVYYICMKYKKYTKNLEEVLEAMRSRFCNENLMLWPIFAKVPETFREQHIDCCRFFMDKQICSIHHNISLYNKKIEVLWNRESCRSSNCRTSIDNSLDIFKKVFFTKYSMPPLANESLLMHEFKFKQNKIDRAYQLPMWLDSENKEKIFSDFSKYKYTLRQIISKCEKFHRDNYTSIDDYLKSKNDWWKFELNNDLTEIYLCEYNQKNYPLQFLDIYYGKPIIACKSSMFVHLTIMNLLPKFIPFEQDPLWYNQPKVIVSSNKSERLYDIKMFVNEKMNFGEKQANFFTKLLDCLLNTSTEELSLPEARLIFVNLPFLTHYSVSFLHYLARFVYKNLKISNIPKKFEIHLIGLHSFYRSSLYKLKSILMEKSINECNHNLSQPDLTIHRYIKIKELQADSFCYPILFFNNNLLLHNLISILENEEEVDRANSISNNCVPLV